MSGWYRHTGHRHAGVLGFPTVVDVCRYKLVVVVISNLLGSIGIGFERVVGPPQRLNILMNTLILDALQRHRMLSVSGCCPLKGLKLTKHARAFEIIAGDHHTPTLYTSDQREKAISRQM
jgi:hypothetical protein